MISRRAFVAGGLAAVGGGSALRYGLLARPHADEHANLIVGGEERAWRDGVRIWWDEQAALPGGARHPRVRPVGGDTLHWGLAAAPEPADHVGPLWMMESFHKVAYWRAINGDAAAKRIVALQWRWLLTTLGPTVLADATTDVNASDDGAWKVQYLAQVLAVTSDPSALDCLRKCMAAVLDRFRDTRSPQIDTGSGFRYSPFGIQYKTEGGGAAGQGESSTYEVGIGIAALDIWRRTGLAGYRAYAEAMSDWFDRCFKHPGGCYYDAVSLDHGLFPGVPLHSPVHAYYGYPKIGASQFLLGGNMGAAVLNARLFKATGDAKYRTRSRALAMAIARPQTDYGFLLTTTARPGVFLQSDPWSDGFWSPEFATEVLAGYDAASACRQALTATGAAIVADRSDDGYYSADWGGDLRVAADYGGLITGYRSYQAHFDANPTAGTQAGRHQIMTDCNSISMLQAARCLV